MTTDTHAPVLVVEDDPGIAELERERLEDAGYRVVVADTAAAAEALVRAGPVALVLLDNRLPGGVDGLEFYSRLRAAGFDPPVILVTGFSDEGTVIRALRAGVRDFVTKSIEYLDYLPEAVGRVLGQVSTERRLVESEALFRDLADNAPMLVWLAGPDGRRAYFNRVWLAFTGRSMAEELGDGWAESIHPDDRPDVLAGYHAALGRREPVNLEYRLRRADGAYRWVIDTGIPRVSEDGEFRGYVGSVLDITDRRLAEEARRRAEVQFRRVWERSHDGMRLTDEAGVVRRVNDAYCRIVGLPREQLEGRPLTVAYAPDQRPLLLADHAGRFATRSDAPPYTKDRTLHDGRKVQLDSSYAFIDPPGQPPLLLSVVRDITAQTALERQFRQAQKMEVVGRLAGGVAHDFNNLLTVINGFNELALELIPPDQPASEMIREARRSGDRATDLTRQLLALSRQQVLSPKVLDLNGVVRDASRMLRRLIGADVALETHLDPGLRAVKADPGQLEQVVMNLAVNARDAMPTGGRLTVETRNADLDGGIGRSGAFVVLRVTDTGTGMTPEVRERIFDPFFTTKDPGKGTGLGLATVYGIVTQAGGHLAVDTAVGRGTTFEVYLPASDEVQHGSKTYPVLREGVRGSETVLLAEDDEAVRGFARRVLATAGYTVLEAADAEAVASLCKTHPGPVHLLVTDVVMPGLGGRELAARVTAVRPGVRVVYLSGYTPDAVLRHGVEQATAAFLQKPFTPGALTAKVREVLDADPGPAGG